MASEFHLSITKKFKFSEYEDNILMIFDTFCCSHYCCYRAVLLLQSRHAIKKQTSGPTEKGPVRLSNTCCEMVSKWQRRKNKKTDWRDTDYTQRNGRTRFLYHACVSGRKVPFATLGWPDSPQRKRSTKIQPNGKYDRN